MTALSKASASQRNARVHQAVLCQQMGCIQPAHLSSWGTPGFPHKAPTGRPTMLVGRVDISSKVQQALQAGHALGLLAGQVQGAALVDLSQ